MELYLSLNSSTSTILSAISAEPFTPPEPIESTTIQHRDRQFEAATPLYHIYTPGVLTRETTTISRISPAVAHDAAYQFKSNKSSDLKECTEYEGGGVEEIARIHWRMASASKLVYQGKVLYINKFMPAGGFLWLKRTFTGPDGLSYSWHLGTLTTHPFLTKLHRTDESGKSTEIARFHQRPWGIPGGRPYLEIKVEGLHMVELIVITWVFVETRRRDMERKGA